MSVIVQLYSSFAPALTLNKPLNVLIDKNISCFKGYYTHFLHWFIAIIEYACGSLNP